MALTAKQVADELGVTSATISTYKKRYLKFIPHEGEGRTVRFYPEAVDMIRGFMDGELPMSDWPKYGPDGLIGGEEPDEETEEGAEKSPSSPLIGEGGLLSEADVLHVLQDEDHPKHDALEWDDERAAHLYRLQQLRELL